MIRIVTDTTSGLSPDLAKQYDIRILDTRTIGAPLGRMILLAARWAEAGVEAVEIIARLQALIPRQRLYFLVDTLEYLQKGGRIGGAFVGSILQMKAILALRDGRVEPIERQRTQRRALQRLKEIVMTESAQGVATQLSIMHADCLETAKALASDLQQSLNTPDVLLMDLVPAIVTHTGPGALAVGFIAAEES